MAAAFAGCIGEPPEQDLQAQAQRRERIRALKAAPTPIQPGTSFWIDELTWMEVRDRIADGDTTVIVPTGGIEQNGPFLTTGKHNVILRASCPEIARQLGNTLCAPVVPFVPEGTIDPPSGAMHFAGTISLQDTTYRALLDDIGSSLKQHGFKDVVFIGDSGGNQSGMERVATELNRRWQGSGAAAHFVRDYYDPGWEATEEFTRNELGVSETRNDGHHDDIWVTAMMMVTDPRTVRYSQRVEAGLASINGVPISLEETVSLGKRMIEFRAGLTVQAIQTAIQNAPR